MRYYTRMTAGADTAKLLIPRKQPLSFCSVSSVHMLDETAAPRANYEKAKFRLWYPENAKSLRAVVVLVPGSNADGRQDVSDRFWQAFAVRNDLALIGCYFTDKPHKDAFIENYANASQGSGQALLDALTVFSNRTNHSELATAPLLLWGFSAGGQFNYEFTAWKPERVAAFVVNKGGVYFSALLPAAARQVPGFLFAGAQDLGSRKRIIASLFALNRRAGALWGYAEEPNVGHAVGQSREMAATFFDAILPLRLHTGASAAPAAPLTALDQRAGILGDIVQGELAQGGPSRSFRPASNNSDAADLTAWFPTEQVASTWLVLLQGKPLNVSSSSDRKPKGIDGTG